MHCDGIYVVKRLVPDGKGNWVEQESRFFFWCSVCNGMGYEPKGGWTGANSSPIIARKQGGRQTDVKGDERQEVNALGQKHGCHTCGKKTPTGTYVPDHCPPSGLYERDGVKPTGAHLSPPRQHLRPHCKDCSRSQGGKVKGRKDNLTGWGWFAPRGSPHKPCQGCR